MVVGPCSTIKKVANGIGRSNYDYGRGLVPIQNVAALFGGSCCTACATKMGRVVSSEASTSGSIAASEVVALGACVLTLNDFGSLICFRENVQT